MNVYELKFHTIESLEKIKNKLHDKVNKCKRMSNPNTKSPIDFRISKKSVVMKKIIYWCKLKIIEVYRFYETEIAKILE